MAQASQRNKDTRASDREDHTAPLHSCLVGPYRDKSAGLFARLTISAAMSLAQTR